MDSDGGRSRRAFGGLLWTGFAACVFAAGCSEMHPEPDEETEGMLESPTQESDNLRESEERQDVEGGGRR
jgi:hypothetical protein